MYHSSDSVVLNNYVQLFTSNRVLGGVAQEENYTKGYDTLAANTTAENVKNTDIINVAISTSDAKQSRALLEAAIDSFRKEAKTLYGDNNVKINVVDGASLPAGPANIKPLMQIGVALAAGFALAIISLFFMYDYRASRRSKTAAVSQADRTSEVPAGARIDTPRDGDSVEAKLVALEPSDQDIMFGVSVDAESETPAPKAKAKSKSKKTTKSTKTSTKKSKKQP